MAIIFSKFVKFCPCLKSDSVVFHASYFVYQSETKDEIAALQKESEVPLDQLLESLPKEILEKPAPISTETVKDEKVGTLHMLENTCTGN